MTSTPTRIAIAASAVAVALIVAYFLLGGTGGSPNAAGSAAGIAADDHTMGSPTAPITIIEYAAPSCPVCAAFDAQVFPELKKTYIDTGKVFYVFRVFPLRPADGAAEAMAHCLPKEAYFEFIGMLFRRQAEWDPEFGITDVHGALVQMGRVAGMGASEVDRCIDDKKVQDRVNQVAEQGQAQYSLNATPTFIINGELQEAGAIPWDSLQQKIEAELKKNAAPEH